tara:strand:+ start:499 stop:975 length:477 start_codon:yes stop_codon:yes gene_type:complete
MFDTQLPIDTMVIRLSAAVLLSMLLGWERESKDRPAGIRTHMLVGLGSAAFFLLAVEFSLGHLKELEDLRPDPTRVFQGIITGIGFLGAGAIIQRGGNVMGLTTGAGVWVSGAIGLACGAGYLVLAGLITAFAFIVLSLMHIVERKYVSSTDEDRTDN